MSLPSPTAVAGGMVFSAVVCVSVFPHDISKTQISKLARTCSITVSDVNPFTNQRHLLLNSTAYF